MDGAEIVTGKAGRKKETLLEGGRFRQQTSLADLQQCAQIDQSGRDESPKFNPVQEYSAYPTRCLPQPEGFCLAVIVTPTHPQSGEGLDD